MTEFGRARVAAREVLTPFPLTEKQKDQLALVIVAHVADAVSQALTERDEELQRARNAVRNWKETAATIRTGLRNEIEQQAEEIARMKKWATYKWAEAQQQEIARLNREIKNLLYGGRGDG